MSLIWLVLAGQQAPASGQAPPADSALSVVSPQEPASASQEQTEDVSDLPLREIPEGSVSTDMFGIFISGDGGWWTLDNTVSQVLAEHGVPMVGLSSYKYFATAHSPDSTAADMTRVLRHYLRKWRKERIVLAGYSLGAEIIPFVATRLPDDLSKRVVMVIMIGPSANTMFEFHSTDWVVTPSGRKTYPVQPEIERIPGAKLCAYADGDETCICDKLDPSQVVLIKRSGNHHFDGDYQGLAEAVWNALAEVK